MTLSPFFRDSIEAENLEFLGLVRVHVAVGQGGG